MLVRSLAVDTSAMRDSRDFRLLTVGGFVSGLGSQVTLVALPYQVFVLTRSSLAVGLIGLVELLPMVVASLVGGTLADRMDRRRLLLLAQLVMLSTSVALALLAVGGSPPLAVLYVLAAVAAAGSGIDRPVRSAIIPNIVSERQLRPAISFNYGLYQLTIVVGPAVGGVVIAATGLSWAYGLDVLSFVAILAAVLRMTPQPAPEHVEHEPVLVALRDGLRFAAGRGELLGSFAIDLLAMTFGMPRALFPALSLTVYHAGATGVGLLYAAVSLGAVAAAFSTGWLSRVRRLGRIVAVAVAVWGAGVAVAGVTASLWAAMLCLLVAGAADSVSAVCRSTILQTATPDAMRGRMWSIHTVVVAGGPRVGDIESGVAASVLGAQAAVVSGGLLCLAGIVPIVLGFPAFWHYGEDSPVEDPGGSTIASS